MSIEPRQLELYAPAPREEIDVDGVVDARGVHYIGKAARRGNGTWVALADVLGSLCLVEVRITPR